MSEICSQIWQILFMFIMHDKTVELKQARRRLFQTRRRPLPEPEVESDNSSSNESEDDFLTYDSILEYFEEKGFDLDIAWAIFMRNLTKSAIKVNTCLSLTPLFLPQIN